MKARSLSYNFSSELVIIFNPQIPVNSARNYGRTGYGEEGVRKSRDTEFWSKWSKWRSKHSHVVQRIFLVILNACVLGYLITAIMFHNSQGKIITVR